MQSLLKKKPTIFPTHRPTVYDKITHPTRALSGLGKSVPFSTQTNMYQTIGYFILYTLVIIVAIVILLMLLGVPIKLSFLDFRSSSKKVTDTSILFWDKNNTFTNFQTPPNALQTMGSSPYTALIDCVLFNTRSFNNVWKDGEGPYRHIFHRGSDDLILATVKGTLLSGCGARGNAADLPEYGLPADMNPGVFLDPNLNDILVFVDTEGGDRESLRIPNIPLDIPFRIGIILNDRVLEFYLNCRLETTKILKYKPKKVDNVWYGIAGAAGAEAQIQNLRVWNKAITSLDLKDLCSPGNIPVFNDKRVICDAAETPIPPVAPAPAPTQKNQVDLGFSAAIAKCQA